MIKDVKTGDYFTSIEEFKRYLSIDLEIDDKCTLSISNCSTEQDFADYGNEYELKFNDGMMAHEYKVI